MSYSLIASVSILNISFNPIFFYKFDRIPCRLSELFCREFDRIILKFLWKNQRFENTPKMLKKNQVEGLSLPGIKIHYKTIIRPCAIAIRRDKYLNQWNREHRYKYIYIET